MARSVREFPTVAQLFQGAVLATIANALFNAGTEGGAYEHWWDGDTYYLTNSQGSRGAITFIGTRTAVGYLFTSHSPRNPFPQGQPPYDPSPWLTGMPADLQALGEARAQQYILEDYRGRTIPVFTVAFWSEGGRLIEWNPSAGGDEGLREIATFESQRPYSLSTPEWATRW